jgi:GNAT superfamily N-acetyltransferase
VWREWLDDPEGLLATAQYGSHAVGIAKVTHLSPGQWWLEGLRVNPNFQGLKIGSHLHEYMDRWWLRHGDGVIRLMTSSQRVQVHHLCERTGYTKLGEVAGYRLDLTAPAVIVEEPGFFRARSAEGPAVGPEGIREAAKSQTPPEAGQSPGQINTPSPLVSVPADHLSSALDFASAHLSDSTGLMDSGWRFSTPDETNLAALASVGHLHWWRDRLGLLAAFEDEDDGQRVLAIGFAAVAELPLLVDLLGDAIELARREGFTSVKWLAPVQTEVQAALQDAGYVTDWEHTGYLYGKPHPGA